LGTPLDCLYLSEVTNTLITDWGWWSCWFFSLCCLYIRNQRETSVRPKRWERNWVNVWHRNVTLFLNSSISL
jgi:hypothetical protein